jgi:hypothetical protein
VSNLYKEKGDMNRRYFITALLVSCLIAGLQSAGPIITASSMSSQAAPGDEGRNEKAKKKKNSDKVTVGRSLLWQNPADIKERDLFYGIGGKKGSPDPSGRFVFLKRDTSGSKEKIKVRDDQNRKWTVKFGTEARPEVVATRIVWAVGFHVDQDYFVRRAHIDGRGGFDVENVRFERDEVGYKTVGRWQWGSNPFVGTRELGGLKVLMALLNNYDLKSDNTKIVQLESTPGGGRDGLIYYVNDLGATLGSTGTWLTTIPIVGRLSMGTKGIPVHFAEHGFIDGVRNRQVVFHHKRRSAIGALSGVKVEDARWMGNLLSRLSDRQLEDAFRAGGYNKHDIDIYVRAIRNRIRQLRELSYPTEDRRVASNR